METVKLLNYMENIRYDRKMTQGKYLEEVVSQRQFYRYRSGESEIPFDVLNKLANKLQIPLLKIISSFQEQSQIEKEIVTEFYNLVVRKRFVEATRLMKKHESLNLLDDETIIFYYLSQVLLDFYQDRITNDEMTSLLKEKINFSKLMKKAILHDNELYFLGVIMEYSEESRIPILKKISDLREGKKLILKGNVIFNSQIYFWIIKNLGRLERYDELIEVASEAIDYAKKNYSIYSLEYFFYYKALAYFFQDKKESFEEELKNTVFSLFYVDSYKRDHFFETINKDTKIDVKNFILDRIKKELL